MAVVYKAAFDKDEPAKNPFQAQRKTRRNVHNTTTPQPEPASTTATDTTATPSTPPTDKPTDAPAQPTPETPIQTNSPPEPQSQTPSKVDEMELAIVQMQDSQSSLETTITKLETNVDKISTSVGLIAKSQSDLQKKFEAFMENSQADKKRQQTEITSLLHDAMHEHVYPQLNALFNETNDRFAYLETLFERIAPPSSSSSDNGSDEYEQTPMDTSTTIDVSGHKHSGSPSRTKSTPPLKRASRSLTFSPAATPGSPEVKYFPASQAFSDNEEQRSLRGRRK